MLAAASSRPDDLLGTVRLALLLESQGVPLSDEMSEYLSNSLEQAQGLIDRPDDFAQIAKPESVIIALTLLASEVARTAVASLMEKKNQTESAGRLLENLESYIDASGQPAHFGSEVYAAI